MGQVFSWNALKKGQIPRLEDFPRVVSRVRDEMLGEASIVGSLACGSVIRGDHNMRSDIDCFVLYDHERQAEAFAFMQKATALAARLYVPLCFIPVDTLLVKTRLHHVGASFREHLKRSIAAGGLLKGDPLQDVASSVQEEDELEAYLRVKMYNLQEAWGKALTFSDERRVSYLQKLLEAPMHVARKTLAHQGLLTSDSKAHVQITYRRSMPRPMADQLEALVMLDTLYTQDLMEQRMHPNERTYAQLLSQLLAESDKVLAFIRANLAFVAATAR